MKHFTAEIPAYLPNGYFWIKTILAEFMFLEDRFIFSKHGPAHSVSMGNSNQKLTVPCHFSGGNSIISEVEIVQEEKWQNKHWGNICSNYSHLPYFNYLSPEIEPLFQQSHKRINELHFSIIQYLKYMWRLPAEIQLATNVFPGHLPEKYVSQWHEKFNFSEYLIYPFEKKYILPKAYKASWKFLEININNEEFTKHLSHNVLFLLFNFGTDFPGLVKKYSTIT